MEVNEPAAVFPVAAQRVQVCRAKVRRFGLSWVWILANLQLVCLWWERHSERRDCGYISYVSARAGSSFWPACCYSDFRACCGSCLLEY